MSEDYLAEVIQAVRDWDTFRERSLQRLPGWSNMADCRAYLGFLERGDWATEDDENWRAVVGTVMHEWLVGVRVAATMDKEQLASFELPVVYRGVPGHLDEMNWTTGELTDYKFPRLASARVWDDPDVLEEKFVQTQGYAAAVMESRAWAEARRGGMLTVDEPLVRMLVCPVDGKFGDWRVYERPFDREVADAAVERYLYVKESVAQGDDLPRDKQMWWCENWCEFFSLCRGADPPWEPEPITDPETAAAIERYGLAGEQEAAARQIKKELAPLVRGARGSARGFRAFMTRPSKGKSVLDEKAVEADYDRDNRQVPMIWQDGKPPSLRVVREKDTT